MTQAPVPAYRTDIATQRGLYHVDALALACREANVPFYVACALMEKESSGTNIYGHDVGGVFSTASGPITVDGVTYRQFGIVPVTRHNFGEFYDLVKQGHVSNGVGPAQLTWEGFFPDMEKKGLNPWHPHDNMLYGLQLLHDYRNQNAGQSWEQCGQEYNGAKSYGIDFAAKVAQWKTWLGA